MALKGKKKALYGLVGALGTVAAAAGFIGGFYSPTTTIVVSFAIWAIGATLVNVIAD
ncbi:MAG: hypothetical protein QNJ20_20055 [Paracoccaceae bacterium]|nr:hypothetical protein [Paracoccaceae bacterium]